MHMKQYDGKESFNDSIKIPIQELGLGCYTAHQS